MATINFAYLREEAALMDVKRARHYPAYRIAGAMRLIATTGAVVTASQLAAVADVSRSTMHRHLNDFARAGLVVREQVGVQRPRYYWQVIDPVPWLIDFRAEDIT